MKNTLSTACCASIFLVTSLISSASAAEDQSLTPRAGVVLLNNGELISGTVIAAGNRYDIHLPTGEIRIKRSEVAAVCRDANECYLHKRSGIEVGRVQDHLDLAEWCLKQHLLEPAELELAAARQADASHPKIVLLQSRMDLARRPIKNEPLVRPASATAAVEKTVSQTPLDGMARLLPGGSMETFTNTIQPMLLNHCAKSGCHSARGDNGLQLERVHPKLSGRFTTQRNLQRVMELVDREHPLESKLLQAPIRAHGTAKLAIFTDRDQAQYKQLVQWVCTVAGGRETAPKPTLEERSAPLLQAVPSLNRPAAEQPNPGQPKAESAGEAQAATIDKESTDAASESIADPFDPTQLPKFEEMPEAAPPTAAGDGTEQAALELPTNQRRKPGVSAANVKRGISQASLGFVPKDPFDPEIFNRRFFAR